MIIPAFVRDFNGDLAIEPRIARRTSPMPPAPSGAVVS